MERLEALKNYYETHNEDIRLESRHGMVEFLTTIHYIQKYLKQNMNILEIGAGTGKYSHYFARKGYNVDAIELITQNIEIFKKNTEACENISIQQRDAINLENIPSEKYDITLLLGPMYHLYTEDDKKSAIKEAIRVTKKDGIIFVSYCNNDMTVYDFGFLRGGFKNEYYKKLTDFNTFSLSSNPQEIFALYRKEDVDALMKEFQTERLHYIGTDMLTRFIRTAIDEMDDNMFEIYMKYHLCICERLDMIGATSHMLDIFRKI